MAWLRLVKHLLYSFKWAAPEVEAFYYVDLSTEPPQLISVSREARPAGTGGIARWPGRRKKRATDDATTAAVLVDECSAYVTGRFQNYLEWNRQPVPGWAWVNSLAHGDLLMVRRLAEATDRSGGPQAAVREIARQVLRIVDEGHETLEDLQHRVLVRLESALAEACPAVVPVDAAQLRQAIKDALGSSSFR